MLLLSCAMSMSPSEVNEVLPTMTYSKFLTEEQANRAVETDSCKCLNKERKYAAPQGLTVNGDLKYAAKGIDEWVELDKGNAYVLTGFKWESVGDLGGTQLFVEFDTYSCNL